MGAAPRRLQPEGALSAHELQRREEAHAAPLANLEGQMMEELAQLDARYAAAAAEQAAEQAVAVSALRDELETSEFEASKGRAALRQAVQEAAEARAQAREHALRFAKAGADLVSSGDLPPEIVKRLERGMNAM